MLSVVSNCLSVVHSTYSGAFGKFQEGKKMARAVELMLEKPGDYGRMKSAAIYKCEVFIHHWTQTPLLKTLAPLLVGYGEGLKVGDNDSAGHCSEYYHFTSLTSFF